MATLFLNMGPRRSGGELLPEAPFRAFARFETKYGKKGGFAVLNLALNGMPVGTATIDWPSAEERYSDKLKKYWVAKGALDDCYLSRKFSDQEISRLIKEAMERSGWKFYIYTPTDLKSLEEQQFENWITHQLYPS